jgi:Fic family protein
MIDDNWELISGAAAHEIEVLNYSNQVNVIDALVHLLMHHHRGEDGTCTRNPNQRVLQEFHRTATLFLLENPGAYRDGEVAVKTPDGTTVHQPPLVTEMQGHLDSFFETLLANWSERDAIELGAYCLWMINWVHPFKNGNGRTARAFAYACMSLKLGFVLPGAPTVIDLIMRQRDEYQDALKIADIAFESTGKPELGAMIGFIDRLLAEQLSSIS